MMRFITLLSSFLFLLLLFSTERISFAFSLTPGRPFHSFSSTGSFSATFLQRQQQQQQRRGGNIPSSSTSLPAKLKITHQQPDDNNNNNNPTNPTSTSTSSSSSLTSTTSEPIPVLQEHTREYLDQYHPHLHSHETKLTSSFKKVFQSYNHCLLSYPYTTKILSSALIGGLGDLLIQSLPYFLNPSSSSSSSSLSPITPTLKIDWRRFAVFTSVSGLYIAPVIHWWFEWLNSLKVVKEAETGVKKALVMIGIDQTVGNVVVNGGFFYAFELIQRLFPPYTESFSLWKVIQAGNLALKNNLWKTMVANWYSWPIINFLNFLYVPLQFRLLVSNVAAIFWNMYLSKTANDNHRAEMNIQILKSAAPPNNNKASRNKLSSSF